VVICLERRPDDLHMIQLMTLPPRHFLLHQNPDWFNLSDAGLCSCFGKEELNGCLSRS